jgi:mannosyltransferase
MTATMGRDAVTTPQAPPTRVLRHPATAPVLVGLLAATISVIGIGTPSIWYDEAATITSATRSWPQLIAELGNVDAVHALYYFLMHVVFDVFGYSPTTLRMPSAIATGLAAALVVILGRQLGTARLGLLAGLVFCIIPRVTWMGGEGRSYAITALFGVLLTVIFLWAQSRGTLPRSRRAWVLYGAVALIGCATFIYLALIVFAHGVIVLWRALRGRGVVSLRRWAIAAGAAAILGLPLAREITGQDGQVAWLKPIGEGTLSGVFRTQWFYGSWPFAIAAWALIIVGVVLRTRRRDNAVLGTLLPVLLVPTIALIAVSLVRAPLYEPRYLTMCTPFVAVAIALGIDAIRWRVAAASLLVLLVVLALPQIIAQRMPEAKEYSSWSEVANLIQSERAADPPGTVTAFIYGTVQKHPSATSRVVAYSYPAPFANSIDVMLLTPAAETAQLWETRAPLAESTSRLIGADVAYLITSNARDLRPATIETLLPLGWHVVKEWDLTAVHVLRFERD